MNEQITQEDLKNILDAANKASSLKTALEKLALETKNAQLYHQTVVQHTFIKYGLSFNDKIDDATGIITRENKNKE